MKINFDKLFGDRVLIKQVRVKKIGSILIAADDQEKSKTAEVLLVGDEVERLKPGDKVLFDAFSDTVLEENDDGIFSLLTESDIIGTVKE